MLNVWHLVSDVVTVDDGDASYCCRWRDCDAVFQRQCVQKLTQATSARFRTAPSTRKETQRNRYLVLLSDLPVTSAKQLCNCNQCYTLRPGFCFRRSGNGSYTNLVIANYVNVLVDWSLCSCIFFNRPANVQTSLNLNVFVQMFPESLSNCSSSIGI